MFRKHFLKILFGIALSIILVYLTLRQVDFKKSLEFIKNANYFVLIPGVLLYAFTYVLRGIRYYFVVLPLKKTPVLANFPYTIIGAFANNLIPLRLGELIRAKITGERFSVSRSSMLATIVVEKMFDVIMFIVFFFAIALFMSFPHFIEKSFYMLASLLIICFVVLYLMLTHEKKAFNILAKIPIPAMITSLITGFINKFNGGLVILRKPYVLTMTFIMSAVIWIIEVIFLVIVACACGVHLSFLGAIFTVIVIGMGAIIPTAPGYFGAFELMGVLALSTIGVNKDAAFACIATYHFLQLIVIFSLGIFCVIKTKLSFADLFKFTKAEEDNE
jgi:uncharacterized protein (TIRG00374 family)